MEAKRCEKGNYRFKFSIIIAVYNVDPFLEETIESIITQSIGFVENVQLILINDGSSDGSDKICDKYSDRYPKNIIAIHKKNGGVSSARNEGLKYIEGEYVNCLDGDDKLSVETLSLVYDQFEKWKDETDIITIPLCFFDGKKGEHLLNTKFREGTRLIHILDEYDKPLFSLSASFVKNDVIKKYRFDEKLAHAEDGKIVMQILLDKMCYGVLKEATYWYRKRTSGQASAIQGSLTNKLWYTNYMKNFALWTLSNCVIKLKYVPFFIQFAVMYDLQWRFCSGQAPEAILNCDEYEIYMDTFKKVLSFIDDQIILEQKQMFIEHKLFALKLKYGCEPEKKVKNNDILYRFGEKEICLESDFMTKLEFLDFNKDKMLAEGLMVFPNYKLGDDIKIFVSVNNDLKECKVFERKLVSLSMGKNISYGMGFKISISLKEYETNEIKFYCKINGNLVEKKRLRFGKFCPIQNAMWNSYYVADHKILTYCEHVLYVYPYSFWRHFYRELSFLKGLLLQKKIASKKAIVMRILYRIYMLFPHKEVWLITDRVNKADDNGEVFFEYLVRNKIDNIRPFFAISKESSDYKRIKEIGKVIKFDGWLYKWFYLCGAKIISSQGEDYIYRPFAEYSYCYSDLIKKSRFIFLQHGIIKDDLSRWLKKYNKNIHMFVTSTRPEYESILDYDYGYTDKEVRITGLPRYDKLYHDEKKYITIVPSWRAYLLGSLDVNTGKHTVLDKFAESEYCKMYTALLTNEYLISAAVKYGYTIRFMSHPNMSECVSMIKMHKEVKVLQNEEISYREMFAESKLLITDYSSIAFDFAYLRKPVLYFQADYEEFFGGNHTYDKGYFEYETDGFGEVAYNVETIVALIVEYMKNDCVLKEEYQKRIDDTFPYNDKKNCERVYTAITEVE